MQVDQLQRVARNITAALVHIDPLQAFPSADQSERRIRFRDNPHEEFLKCSDDEQRRISELLMASLSPEIIDLAFEVEEEIRREIGA